jgi:hypothetical protein
VKGIPAVISPTAYRILAFIIFESYLTLAAVAVADVL